MSSDIQNRLFSFVRQEQTLLTQLGEHKRQSNNVFAEVAQEIISKGVKDIISDFFDSAWMGRTGQKITKKKLAQSVKEQLKIKESEIERRHNNIVREMRAYLDSISEWKPNLSKENSTALRNKLENAQNYVKIETKIKHTIRVLEDLTLRRLVYNKEIPLAPLSEVVVPHGKPLTGKIELKKILGSAQGYVKIIDSYVSDATLELLLAVPEKIPIKLLTENIGGKKRRGSFLRTCKQFKVERPSFEIRKCEKGKLHDRLILTEERGWIVGQSLKDFGKKHSTIKELSKKGKKENEEIFNQYWALSKDLIMI